MSKVLINYDQLCGLADHARRVGTLDALADVALQWAGQADKEMERLTAALQHEADCVEAAKAEIERLTAERDDLHRQLDEANKTIHNLKWALGTEGYDQMATPEEQAEHEAAVRAHHDVLERLEEGKRAYEAMKRDAQRYRFIRDADRSDAFVPIESILCYSMESIDAAIDAAMGASNE